MTNLVAASALRALSSGEIALVAGGGDKVVFVDSNRDGQLSPGEKVLGYIHNDTDYSPEGFADLLEKQAAKEGQGSFYGGGWIAGITGAGVWGGGGESHAAWLLGAGYGGEFGYSSHPAVAAEESDNTSLRVGLIPGFIIPGLLDIATNIKFDMSPFTIGF
jgi:hypothetical protein